MWGRIGGVAGNIRTNVSQLAKDVLEGDEDSPRQEPRHAPTSQILIQQPLSGGVFQRPYYQPAAAGVPPSAEPTTQQQKLPQQIPFMPQPTAGARAGAKPALFVPSQHGSRTNPVLMPNSTSTSANEASTGPQGVLQPRQTPAVSSRLSALKARLDSEKHRSSGDDTPSGPRSLNANQPSRPSLQVADELSAAADMQTAGLHAAQELYTASPSSQDHDYSLSAQPASDKAAESHIDADTSEPAHATDPDRDAVWQEELQQQQAESDRLQAELKQLKSAHEQLQVQHQELSQQSKAGAESDEQSEAVAHLMQQLQQANQDLAGQRAKTMALQQVLEDQGEEIEAAQTAAVASAAASVDSPVSRDGSQTASVSGRSSGSRALLPNGKTQGLKGQDADAHEGPGIAPAEGLPQLTDETHNLQQRLAAVEKERDKAKQQLNRLKQQLMTEQEEEEEMLRWRVDAEVKLALEEFQKAEAQRGAGNQGEVAELKAGMDSANAQIQQMHEDLQAWEQAVSARDAELRNLQAALGELTFESEAADRMRGEVRSAQRQVDDLQHQLQQSAEQVQAAQQAQAQAQQLAADASNGTQEQQRIEKQLQDEAAMLRRALNESMRRVESLSDEGLVQVDRRIVVKLLVTFFEKGQSQEVLSLMARILAFTDEDKARVGLTRPRKGVFSRVTGALSLSNSTSKQAADDSLADQCGEPFTLSAKGASPIRIST
ncbi:hypothetical protein WJX82_008657 [Trebouxia sp. C0006]